MKNKKGLGLEWYFLIISFFLGLVAFFIYSFGPHKVIGNYIGEQQFSILKVANKAESALLYVGQSAKYSLQQTIYELANRGGYYEPACSSFNGANAWAVIERGGNEAEFKECYPSTEKIKESFREIFKENLNNYIANYPEANIPGSYNYELRGNLEITGKATENIVINIVPEGFAVKPTITTSNPTEIYQQVVAAEIPPKPNEPQGKGVNVKVIQDYHKEVWTQYAELCRRMGASPGVCDKDRPTKCCVTSGYRHPAYNKEIGGAGNSPHQYGVALDIYVGKGKDEQLKWAREASTLFTRVGIYPTDAHIHVDLMPPKGEYQVRFWIGNKGTTLAKASSIDELENKARAFT